LLPRNSWAVIF